MVNYKRFTEKRKTRKALKKHSKRELINAVLYLNKTGCQWHLLPNDFPPYKTVSSFYQRVVKSGLWEKIMSELVKKNWRFSINIFSR